MKKFIKQNKGILISSMLTVVIICIIFAQKGIFPFGESTFGMIDFDHAYTPVYYKLWDILHGNTTALFDWNLGAGLNSFGSLIMNSLIFPTSLIIGLFPRNMIPEAMTFIIILKFIEMTIFSYIALNKLFPNVDYKYKIAFTLLYTFSGWTFFNFFNLLYLDVVALFPLFVLAYYRLMKENKWGMYVIVLTLCLLLNYYMSWMILFFIIGITVISLITLDIKEKRKKAVLVILLTLGSLGLSCCLFLPSFYQSMSSARMNGESYEHYYSWGVFFLKLIALFPLSITLFLNAKQLLIKKEKKKNIFFGALMIYLLAGIFIEPINLWWHTGSYNGFPFRYSYIPTFISICIAMYYLNNNYECKIKKSNYMNIIGFTIVLGIMIFLACFCYKEISSINIIYEVEKLSQFLGLAIIFVTSIACAYIIFKNTYKMSCFLSISLVIINSIMYGMFFITSGEQSSVRTQKILNDYNLKNDFYNYSDYTYELNFNYPYILNVPSMENRIHIISQESYNLYSNLGYNNVDSIMLSKGGTLFSNLLLNNKYIFTKRPLNDQLYNLLEEHDDLYLYEAKYNLDYIIPYNGNIYNEDTGDIFTNQNNIYKMLFDKEDNLIEKVDQKSTYDFEKGNIYYVYVTCVNDYYCNNFEFLNNVNIEQVTSFGTSGFNNYYEFYVDEETSLEVNKEYVETIQVAYINIDKYINFFNEINNYEVNTQVEKNVKTFEYKADKNTHLLIPIPYDNAFKILVNGEEVPYELNIYNMLSINVKEGKNKIELIYVPKKLVAGIAITVSTALIFLIIILVNKKFVH